MPNLDAEIKFDQQKGVLQVLLPLTTPTGKIRVKRRKNTGEFGKPIATTQTPLTEADYIEWQITYDTGDPNKQSAVKEISFQRNNKLRYGFELTTLLYEGIRHGVFEKEVIERLLTHAGSIKEADFLENRKHIIRESKGAISANNKRIYKFYEDKYPVFIYERDDFVLEVKIMHKQKAVGYQAMIYICLPLKNAIGSEEINLIGRPAKSKERAIFEISRNKNNFVLDAFEIFAEASKRHNEDVIKILKEFKRIF